MDTPSQPASNVPLEAQIMPYSAATAPAKPRRRWLGLLAVLLFLGLAASLVINVLLAGVVAMTAGISADQKVQEKYYSHAQLSANKVAIISVEGVIVESEGFVKRQIDQARRDDTVKAIVLRVNSPGGSVSASDYLYHHLKLLRDDKKLPIVVSMGGLAASGGYYVSMAVGGTPDSIFAEPTTWTGSIGVIIPHYNAAGLMATIGLKEESIASHRLKTMGSLSREMTPEERKIFQQLVDESFGRFKGIIQAGRPAFAKNPKTLDEWATGQIFTAEQAQKAGLIDRVGFLDDAVKRAIELAGLSKDDVRVVKYKRDSSLAAALMGDDARAMHASDLSQFLELATPRAWYLCSVLPVLAANGESAYRRD